MEHPDVEKLPVRKPQKGDTTRRWTLYLRLLDARASDRITHKDIANILSFEDIKSVSDRLRKADRLTEPSGYLNFLGLLA